MSEALAILDSAAAAVLLIASLGKLSNPSSAASALARHPLMPARLAGAATTLLIASEAVVASSILSGFFRTEGLVGAGLLLLLFGLAGLVVLRHSPSRPLDCGCLGRALPIEMGAVVSMLNIALGISCLATALSSSETFGAVTQDWLIEGTGALIGPVYWIGLYAMSVVHRSDAFSHSLVSGGTR